MVKILKIRLTHILDTNTRWLESVDYKMLVKNLDDYQLKRLSLGCSFVFRVLTYKIYLQYTLVSRMFDSFYMVSFLYCLQKCLLSSPKLMTCHSFRSMVIDFLSDLTLTEKFPFFQKEGK